MGSRLCPKGKHSSSGPTYTTPPFILSTCINIRSFYVHIHWALFIKLHACLPAGWTPNADVYIYIFIYIAGATSRTFKHLFLNFQNGWNCGASCCREEPTHTHTRVDLDAGSWVVFFFFKKKVHFHIRRNQGGGGAYTQAPARANYGSVKGSVESVSGNRWSNIDALEFSSLGRAAVKTTRVGTIRLLL